MKRIVCSFWLALLILLVGALPAGAARGWCRADPVVRLDNYTAAVYLSAPLDQWHQNSSSGDVLIEHPKDTVTMKLWEDPNLYFGQGVSTNFTTNSTLRKYATYMDIQIKVRVPATTNAMPILVEWAPGPVRWDANGDPLPNPVLASKAGFANQWIVLKTKLPYST